MPASSPRRNRSEVKRRRDAADRSRVSAASPLRDALRVELEAVSPELALVDPELAAALRTFDTDPSTSDRPAVPVGHRGSTRGTLPRYAAIPGGRWTSTTTPRLAPAVPLVPQRDASIAPAPLLPSDPRRPTRSRRSLVAALAAAGLATAAGLAVVGDAMPAWPGARRSPSPRLSSGQPTPTRRHGLPSRARTRRLPPRHVRARPGTPEPRFEAHPGSGCGTGHGIAAGGAERSVGEPAVARAGRARAQARLGARAEGDRLPRGAVPR